VGTVVDNPVACPLWSALKVNPDVLITGIYKRDIMIGSNRYDQDHENKDQKYLPPSHFIRLLFVVCATNSRGLWNLKHT